MSADLTAEEFKIAEGIVQSIWMRIAEDENRGVQIAGERSCMSQADWDRVVKVLLKQYMHPRKIKQAAREMLRSTVFVAGEGAKHV